VYKRGARRIKIRLYGEIFLRNWWRRCFFPIETIMETHNDNAMMAAQAALRVRKDHPAKKSSARQKTNEGGAKNVLYAVSEHSLSGFLEDEPDIYSVSDLKVRYR
jgi:hypothetical protein